MDKLAANKLTKLPLGAYERQEHADPLRGSMTELMPHSTLPIYDSLSRLRTGLKQRRVSPICETMKSPRMLPTESTSWSVAPRPGAGHVLMGLVYAGCLWDGPAAVASGRGTMYHAPRVTTKDSGDKTVRCAATPYGNAAHQ